MNYATADGQQYCFIGGNGTSTFSETVLRIFLYIYSILFCTSDDDNNNTHCTRTDVSDLIRSRPSFGREGDDGRRRDES